MAFSRQKDITSRAWRNRAQSSLWLGKELRVLLKAVRFDLFYCRKIYNIHFAILIIFKCTVWWH